MTPLAIVLLKLAAIAAAAGGVAWGLHIYPAAGWSARRSCRAGGLGLLSCRAELVLAGGGRSTMWAIWRPGRSAHVPRRKHARRRASAGPRRLARKPHPVTLTVLNLAPAVRRVCDPRRRAARVEPQPAEFSCGCAAEPFNAALRARPSRRGAFVIDRVHVRAVAAWGSGSGCWNIPPETASTSIPTCSSSRNTRSGPDQPPQPAGRAPDAADRPGPRFRAAPRLHHRRQLQAHRLAGDRPAAETHGQGFQTSQSQRIVFLMDCGRMMTNQAAGLSLLDHAFNAMLMLSYVALRQGDSVGMISFSDEIHGFVPPRGGMNQMNRLLHASFDRFPQLVESRYDQAFRYLAAHCRKRSLVVLVTNVIDEVNANQMERYLTNLVGRHLPLGVLLRDRRLFDAVEIEHPAKISFGAPPPRPNFRLAPRSARRFAAARACWRWTSFPSK